MKPRSKHPKVRAYSYIRFSSEKQKEGDSLRRQTEAAQNWCQSHGAVLVDPEQYRDLGVSAFKGRHATEGKLAKLLEAIRSGRIPKGSVLLVEALDRLSREDVLTALPRFIDIINSGIRIVTLIDGQEYDAEAIRGGNIAPLMLSLVYIIRSNEESATKGKRIATAWRKKQAEAKRGVKMTRICPAWLRLPKDSSNFEILEEKAAIVRECFSMALAGKSSVAIARVIQNRNIPPLSGRGRGWRAETIRKILHNQATFGTLVTGHWENGRRVQEEAIRDYYPAVIDEKTYATVAQMMARRDNGMSKLKPRTSYSVFGGLVFDQQGRPFYYLNKGIQNGRRNHFLRSSAHNYGTPSYAWEYNSFLESFVGICKEAVLVKPPKQRAGSDIALCQLKLKEAEAEAEKAGRLFMETQSPTLRKLLHEADAKVEAAKAELEKIEEGAVAEPVSVEGVNWEDRDQLRESIRRTVKRITVESGEKIRGMHVEFFDGRVVIYIEHLERRSHLVKVIGRQLSRHKGKKVTEFSLTMPKPTPPRSNLSQV